MRQNTLFLCLVLILPTIANLGYAASFNCAKAATQVETLVCGDKYLSTQDSTLAELYNSLKQKNPGLVGEQKIWLRQKRNVCVSSSCLKSVYSERIDALKNAVSCPADENSLLGSWIRIKGDWAFEKMEFSILDDKKEFTSWLHNHLEIIGTWNIDKCTIHVMHDTEDVMQFYLRINKLDKGRLYLFDTDSQAELVYKYIR